jgi:hypothetical protein
MVFASAASASSLYLVSVQEHFMECISVAAACFDKVGMIPCMIMGIPALFPVMGAVPYLIRQNESPGFLSVLVPGCIAACTAFDAANIISAVMEYHGLYLFAPTVLDTPNKVTGNIAGTRESLW